MRRQVDFAVTEADVVVMLTDGQEGVTRDDRHVAQLARRSGKPVVLAVNKVEGREGSVAVAEFFELGLDTPQAVSASHGDGVRELLQAALALVPQGTGRPLAETEASGPCIAVIGRPNVGKSTLINRLLREERLVTRDEPGTTRDAIRVPFVARGKPYTLIDTAGIRRRARVSEAIEKFSVVKALQAMDEADAVIVLLDAREGVTEQDAALIGLILERGRALTLGINKWDGLTDGQRRQAMESVTRNLPFLDFVEVHHLSALHGSNISELFDSAARAAGAARAELPTQELNRVLKDMVTSHPPPVVHRHRIRLSYAHQGGRRPPLIIIHGNQTTQLPDSYRRFLVNGFRRAFRLTGTPLRIELRTGRNPFAGRRNELSERQIRKRRRIQGRR